MNPKKRFAFACALFLVLLTGCPEAPRISRELIMYFPAEHQNSVSLTVDDAEVQGALKLIDEALVSDGLLRIKDSSEAGFHGYVISYSKTDGRLMLGSVNVYLHADQLEVIINEGRKPSEENRVSANRLINLVRKKLSSHFGPDRIKVMRVKS